MALRVEGRKRGRGILKYLVIMDVHYLSYHFEVFVTDMAGNDGCNSQGHAAFV